MPVLSKKREETAAMAILLFFTAIVVVILLSVIGSIIWRGFSALNWSVLSQVPKGGYYFGKEGGILNAIVGSVYLASGASLIAFLISVPAAIFMHTYLHTFPRWQRGARLCLDVLWGVPPIVYGAFGFNLMLFLGWQSSLLAAIVVVSLLISPVMIRAMDESLHQIPHGLYESAMALGFFKGETGFKFLLRQTLPGVATAFLLALGKGIGDTAAVLFTAGYTDYIPRSITEPAATLPLAIFFQLSSPVPEVKARAYAAALVLTIIILIISIASRVVSRLLSKNRIS